VRERASGTDIPKEITQTLIVLLLLFFLSREGRERETEQKIFLDALVF